MLNNSRDAVKGRYVRLNNKERLNINTGAGFQVSNCQSQQRWTAQQICADGGVSDGKCRRQRRRLQFRLQFSTVHCPIIDFTRDETAIYNFPIFPNQLSNLVHQPIGKFHYFTVRLFVGLFVCLLVRSVEFGIC